MSRRHRWLGKHAIYHVVEDFIGVRHMIVDRIHQLFLGVHDYVRLILLLLPLLVTLLVGRSKWSWEGRDSTFQ